MADVVVTTKMSASELALVIRALQHFKAEQLLIGKDAQLSAAARKEANGLALQAQNLLGAIQ